MTSHEAIMRKAIEVAKHAAKTGGVAIGAALVDRKSGQVAAAGGSFVRLTHDPTAHAEINAIRNAARRFETDDLYNLALYSTLEPCHMCLSAAAWARIAEVYFGAYRKDVDATLFDIKGDFSDEAEGKRMNLREHTRMKVQGGVCEADCAALLTGYHDLARHSF